MIADIHECFERYNDEFLKFERIPNPPSQRPDLCAFLLLDRLVPGKRDIVSCAEHDEIWLDVDEEQFKKTATEEDVLYLTRCGIRWDPDVESFCSYV
jgi:hypothetical protein